MKKLKILLTNASDIYGGGEFFVYQIAGLLKLRGHKVWVSCRRDSLLYEKCSQNKIELFPQEYPKNYGKKGVFRIANEIKKLINETGIDVVHTNTNYDRTAVAIAARLAHVPHVTNNHSFQSINYNLTHWYRNKFLTGHFIVGGKCTKDVLAGKDKIKENKISIIHMGLDPEPYKRIPELRKKIREEFNIKKSEVLIGNVARLVPFKGQEYLIRAFASVKSEYPNSKLMIVGDGELSEKLKKLAHEFKMSSDIIFPGFREDIQAIYSAFDIYAHTSVEGGGEAFPYALLYALAQKLPIVSTNVGEVTAIVKVNVNGFLAEDKDINALAGKLKILLADEAKRKNMGEKSYKLLMNEFTEDIMIEKIERVYYKVIEGK